MRARRSTLSTRLLLLSSAALVAAPLAACGADDAADTASEGGDVTISDAWVKASDGPMTGAFGVIMNAGDADVTVVSATTSASEMTELHEVVMIDGEMKMQQKDGGFVVPAGGEHVLEPGNDHVMVMNMQEPIAPGDDVEITLTLDDGSQVSYSAQGREAEVGDEEYVPSEGGMSGDGAGMEESQS
jgi:copper(I)-binding protein